MSLRIFHVVFITLCVIFSIYVAAWGVREYVATKSGGALALGLIFLLCGAGLVVYGVRAFAKLKDIP